jgi:hypothetical protein
MLSVPASYVLGPLQVCGFSYRSSKFANLGSVYSTTRARFRKGAMSKSGLVKADYLQIEERFNSLMTNIFSKTVKLKKNINPEPFF